MMFGVFCYYFSIWYRILFKVGVSDGGIVVWYKFLF